MLKLCYVNHLLPHEKVTKKRVSEIETEITQKQEIFPILVDQKYHIILDGHHRWEVFKKLGFLKIPVYFVDYQNDNLIQIDTWQKSQKLLKNK
jgi:L-serine kinase (ADP)